MEIDKAIELLSDIITFEHSANHSDKGDAIKLGLQALRRCELARKEISFIGPGLLPGETRNKEGD